MHPLLRFGLLLGGVWAAVKVLEDAMIGQRKVFVSFDYENDRNYKRLLQAWSANDRFDFSFNDASSGEIQSNDIGRVKAALTTKIRAADVTLVLVGAEANKPHRERLQIGYRNWINFEVAQSKAAGNRLVAVKLDRGYEAPDELSGAGASWAMSFTDAAVTKALREA
jgi:hypothetical protein